MDFQAALQLKKEISDLYIRKRNGVTRATGYSFSALAGGANKMTHSILNTINGVGVSDKSNSENCVKILLRDAPPSAIRELSGYYNLSTQDIEVEQVGFIKLKMPRDNHRPPYPGISVGHFRVTAGTLGCFVGDKKGGTYVLSNNHVLGNSDDANDNDPVLQPGRLDGGRNPKDIIANLSYLVPLDRVGPNQMDAAIAKICKEQMVDILVNKKIKIAGSTDPRNGLRVEKYGRTTGHTKGTITTRSLDINVEFGRQTLEFQDQCEIKAIQPKGFKRPMFCDGGDSGSIILETGVNNAVGLLFAGNDDGTAFATPIETILNAFAVKIL